MYVLNIHNMPKIFWGAWPLIIFERPKCSKVLVPLSKLSVSKNVWFTNARLGPLDFIHSEMLKRGMGGSGPSGKQPLGSTISGAGPHLGATKGYIFRGRLREERHRNPSINTSPTPTPTAKSKWKVSGRVASSLHFDGGVVSKELEESRSTLHQLQPLLPTCSLEGEPLWICQESQGPGQSVAWDGWQALCSEGWNQSYLCFWNSNFQLRDFEGLQLVWKSAIKKWMSR